MFKTKNVSNTFWNKTSIIVYLVSVGARNQNAFTFIKNTRYVVENYLTPNAIKTNWANLNVALENYVEQFENSRKQSKKQQNTLYSGGLRLSFFWIRRNLSKI